MTNEYLALLRRWMGCTDRRELYRIEARMAEITGWRPRHGTEEADEVDNTILPRWFQLILYTVNCADAQP